MQQFDHSVFLLINGIEWDFLSGVMKFVSGVENWIPIIGAGVLFLLARGGEPFFSEVRGGKWKRAFAARNPRIVILCMMLAVGISDQTAYRIKRITGRRRPCFDPGFSELVLYRGDVHGNLSFPSSHAANSAALLTTVSLAYPPVTPYAAFLVFLVGLSRVHLGVHYPLDVIAGWGLGAACAVLVWFFLGKFAARPGLIGSTSRFRRKQPVPVQPLKKPWERLTMFSLDGYPVEGFFRRGGEWLVVMVHGLNDFMGSMEFPAEVFAELGWSVLLVPLRGHDDHPVSVTTGGPAEVLDLAGALVFSENKLGFTRRRTVLYGTSMGGTVVLKVAGLLEREVPGVIVHGAYANFYESVVSGMGKIAVRFLKLLVPAATIRGLKAFRPLEYASRCGKTKFCYITGELDRFAPPGVQAEMARLTGGKYVILTGRGHRSWTGGEELKEILIEAAADCMAEDGSAQAG